MKYRKKPVVIEAFLWTGGPDQTEDPVWIINAIKEKVVTFKDGMILIHTLEGVMEGSPGDYIIQGVQGEIYPCKPDIFKATYEEVSGEEAEEDDTVPDFSKISNKEKDKLINGFIELSAKHALQLFYSLGLESHIDAEIINDPTGEKFSFSLIKLP